VKRENIAKASSVFVTVCFLLFLLILAVMTVLDFDETESFFENRNLATFPILSTEGVSDGTYFTAVGEFVKDHAAAREVMLKASTLLDLKVLRRPVVNDIYVGGDVLLPYFDHETVDKTQIASDASAVAEKIEKTARITESYGGKYYFTAIPCQYRCYEDSYPWYLNSREEFLEASSEAFFAELEKRDVSLIDVMKLYESKGRPDYFTSTVDHHFGIRGAYDTYLELLRRLDEDTDLSFPVLTEKEFELKTLPNRYIGSRSRKIFGLWESDERLQLILPKEAPEYTRYNNGYVIDKALFDLPENDTDDVLYTTYMGGDVAHVLIDTNREELPSILIYGESFTNAIETFAWYSFDEMHSLDMRHYKDMTVDEFISIVQPEVVVCIRDYSVLLETEEYGF